MKYLLITLMLLSIECALAGAPDDISTISASGRIIDLTHTYDVTTVYWPTTSGFEMEIDFKGITDAGYYYEANTFCTAEHGGTHLDAPIHFAEGKQHTDEIPLDRLIGPGIKNLNVFHKRTLLKHI